MSTNRGRDEITSPFEDQGLPDLEDGAPQQRWARDPEQAPVPGDRPVGVEEFGTTYAEMNEGESLDHKLSREVDEGDPSGRRDVDRVGRLVAEGDDGVEDSEKQELARDVGVDLGGASAEEAAMHVEPG